MRPDPAATPGRAEAAPPPRRSLCVRQIGQYVIALGASIVGYVAHVQHWAPDAHLFPVILLGASRRAPDLGLNAAAL